MRGTPAGTLKLLTMAWEAWRFRRGDHDAITRRQRSRLQALVNHARRSPFLARRVRVFSVLRPLPELVDELNDFQPTALEAYPSALVLLAAEQRAGRLHIRPVMAITAGEHLARSARADIEGTFGCRVENRYGSAEFVALAAECPEGVFHVNVDWFLFEPVDENYRPVPVGVSSHSVLVTNLVNRVQPLIRYDLGDRVKVATRPCPCGNRLPARSPSRAAPATCSTSRGRRAIGYNCCRSHWARSSRRPPVSPVPGNPQRPADAHIETGI